MINGVVLHYHAYVQFMSETGRKNFTERPDDIKINQNNSLEDISHKFEENSSNLYFCEKCEVLLTRSDNLINYTCQKCSHFGRFR